VESIKDENIRRLLEKLGPLIRELEKSPDVEGIAIVSRTGLKIWGYTSSAIDDEVFSAATAAIVSIGERTTKDLGFGSLSNVTVVGEKGFVVMTQISEDFMIAVASSNRTKMGYYMLILQRYSKIISMSSKSTEDEEIKRDEEALTKAIDALEEEEF